MNGVELQHIVRQAGAEALNIVGDDLAGRAVPETPVESGELRASVRFPGNDPASAATEEELEAMVSFNTVYAAAQHEGRALQHRGTKEILWVVKNHPGGGKGHYLEDPFKAMIPRYEAAVAAVVKRKLAEHGI